MSDNGTGTNKWLERALVYAALAQTEDLGEARVLLARDGVHITPEVLGSHLHNARQAISAFRDSGLAPGLVGPEARRARRLARVDGVCVYLEDRFQRVDPPLDRDFAGLLQQYRELMSLLFEQDLPSRGGAAPPAAMTRAAEEVASALNLLEAMNHEQPPAGTSEPDVHDAARRLAAATGFAFPAPEPGEPTVARADRGL